MIFRRKYGTRVGETDYVEEENPFGTRIGEKPVDLFRVAVRPFYEYSKWRDAITYKLLNKGGIFWSFDKHKFSSETLQADFALWFYLLKEFSEKDESIIENVRKKTRVEKENFYLGCVSPADFFFEMNMYGSFYYKKKRDIFYL